LRLAYVDSSCLVAVAFGEAGAGRVEARLRRSDRLFAANLLEAELRAALAREDVEDRGESLVSGITWVYPDRPLTPEFDRILAVGYLKGADLWHLAHALFLAPAGKGLAFLTLDQRQRAVATELGFTA
jgi:predicted nucleic acid-binding protein